MKIDDYDIRRGPKELTDFVDDITTLFNNGKYQFPIIPSNPFWTANNGEMLFVSGSSSTKIGFFVSNTWNLVDFQNQVVRSWVAFSGTGGGQIIASVNVSSVTRDATGYYTITWSPPFSSNAYAMSSLSRELMILGTNWLIQLNIVSTNNNPTNSSVKVNSWRVFGDTPDPDIAILIATGVV